MRGRRKWIMIIFFVILLFLFVFIFLKDDSVYAQTEPPIEGDWVISDTTLKNDTLIRLKGNLIVKDGGTLNLDNVTMKFNCEQDGQYGIDIQYGGLFFVDNSTINPVKSQFTFRFEVNGTMDMNQCLVEYLWGQDFTKSDVRIGGIQIYSDDVIIKNSEIRYTYGDGITCITSSPTIIHNTIRYAEDDGISCNFSSPKIIGNIIEDCHLGIYVYNDSTPIIKNNYIKRTGYEYLSKGISLTKSSRVIVENNTVINFDMGIRMRHSSPRNIRNNFLYDCGLNFINSSPILFNILIDGAYNALYCDDNSNPTLINCTIIESNSNDIRLADYNNGISNVTLINTSVTRISITEGSSITTQWYINVLILSENGDPISNSDIIIYNSQDKNMTRNFKTDENGFVKWIVCTESIRFSNNQKRLTPHKNIAEKEDTGSNWTTIEITENTWINMTLEIDSDGDWVPDKRDRFPFDAKEWLDNDGDGIGNNADLDDDGDGYLDTIEIREETDPLLVSSFPADFDHDFDPDSSDSDDDNDGISDVNDVFPYNSGEWVDSDSDGIGDNEDPDDNNNGIHDFIEIPLIVIIFVLPAITFYFTNEHIKKKKKDKDNSD
jgi:parallel beta-helix repeat protein